MSDFISETITEENLLQVVKFLEQGEAFCVSLMEFFVKDNALVLPQSGIFKIIYKLSSDGTKTIFGVFAINVSGKFVFYFPFLNQFNNCKTQEEQFEFNRFSSIITPLLQKNPLSVIMGELSGARLFAKLCAQKISCFREYILMKNSLPLDLSKIMKDKEQLALLDLTLKKCDETDLEKLYPLQKEYEIVEVLTDCDTHNELNCKINLRYALKTHLIFALCKNGIPVAKCGTNAKGLRFNQIGGVFTDEKWRCKGLAKMLVRYLSYVSAKSGKSSCLFVRNENISAQKAYANAGFSPIGDFALVYF